jgi:hypothetical protein
MATVAQPRHRQVGTAIGRPQCPKLIHIEDLLPRVVIRAQPGTNRNADVNPGAGVTGGVRCSAPEDLSVTVPLETPSVRLTE